MKKVKIRIDQHILEDFYFDDFLTVNVDGEKIDFNNMDIQTIVSKILEHLGYEVDIKTSFNGELI